MPSLTFVLPHWLYWAGLVLFPLFAMYMVSRARKHGGTGSVSLAMAYLFLVTGGFAGIHRFYVKSMVGLVYLPLFGGILYTNSKTRAVREAVSEVKRRLLGAEFDVERFQKGISEGVDGASENLLKAQEALVEVRHQILAATSRQEAWEIVALWLVVIIAVLLLVDAIRLPWLVRTRAAVEAQQAGRKRQTSAVGAEEPPEAGPAAEGTVLRGIDRISGWTGTYVAYWSLLAVFVYFFEVLARYVFNSPTNWAHEGMFLMFGMQYLIAGAMTLRDDGHVRVDVIYAQLSPRWKAMVDVITSVFFFLFAGTLLVTGWIFAQDSVAVWEVSFTEWAIQYWPVKATIALGAFLIILQGLAKLSRDIRAVRNAGGLV